MITMKCHRASPSGLSRTHPRTIRLSLVNSPSINSKNRTEVRCMPRWITRRTSTLLYSTLKPEGESRSSHRWTSVASRSITAATQSLVRTCLTRPITTQSEVTTTIRRNSNWSRCTKLVYRRVVSRTYSISRKSSTMGQTCARWVPYRSVGSVPWWTAMLWRRLSRTRTPTSSQRYRWVKEVWSSLLDSIGVSCLSKTGSTEMQIAWWS